MSRPLDPKLRANVIALLAAGDGVERKRMDAMTDDELRAHVALKAERNRLRQTN